MPKRSAKQRETDIVEFIRETRRTAETQLTPDRQRWELAQNLFAGKQDWGRTREENPWMNKVFIPLFSSVVRQGAATAHNMIFSQPEFIALEVDGEDGNEREFTRILEKMLRYEIRQMGFQDNFYEGMIVGGVYGILPMKLSVQPRLMVRPEVIVDQLAKQERQEIKRIQNKIEQSGVVPTDEDSLRLAVEEVLSGITDGGTGQRLTLGTKKLFELGFRYEIVNPFNRYWEPDIQNINESPWDLEQSFHKLYQLAPLFDSGILDPSKKKDVMKSRNPSLQGGAGIVFSSTKEGQDFSQRDQFTDHSAYFPDAEIWEYFGPLLNRDGTVEEDNRHFIVANEVLCKDQQNPYFLQKSPYFTATFSKIPFKAVGAGVADPGIDQNLLMNDIFSLYMDMLKLAVLSPRVYDSSKIVDPSQLENGIEPNSLIEGTGDASKIFSEIPTNLNVGNSVLQAVEFMRLSAEQGASVDTQSTNPSSRSRITAAEIQSNLSRQSQSQTTLGSIIDNEVIKPLAERTLAGILQFGFETGNLHSLATRGVITENEFRLIQSIDKIERYNELTRNYRIKVKGFRDVLERNDRAQRVTEFISVAAQNPQMNDDVDYKEVLKVLGEALQMDTDKLIRQNTPQDTAREENRILADGKFIQPAPNEEHQMHVVIHYDRLLKGPNEAIVAHIQAHFQLGLQQGVQFQPPPPEVAELLGIGEEPAPQQQVNGALPFGQ